MHRVTFTLNQFDRATREIANTPYAGSHRYLHLTFQSPEWDRQWWVIPGWPEVSPGMTITALLRRKVARNTSNFVLGWKCHQTGEMVVAGKPAQMVLVAILSAVAGAAALHLYSISPDRASLTTPIPGFLFLGLAVIASAKLLQHVLVSSKLRSLNTSVEISG